ncbi:MAG: FAD-dependent oxidoreductase [Nitrospirota bacterium]|nr:FAD-dependent oxidoreductase [Nitrospirota bacterium]
MKKTLLILMLAALLSAFFGLGLDRYLTLDALKAGQDSLSALRADAPVWTAAAYLAIYVVVTALSLPGAAVMSLAGGAVFGLVTGVVLVSFAASVGATLAFLASRYLLHDAVKRRFGKRLKAIYEGMERGGAAYLFTLRLVPIFPFFLVNLLMGLTPIRARTFYWVSQLGMLPATAVFVNAGTQLARISHPSDIVSPGLLASFALLGVFPLLARGLVRMFQTRRMYARWRRPRAFDRNLIVIGGGAAGLVTAYVAAAVRARVTLVEGGRMGGDCLNTGCVPSKALIRSARLAHQIAHADRYGLEPGTTSVKFGAVMRRVREVIARVEPHDSVERYTRLGVEVLSGHARLVDPWTVRIALNDGGTSRLTARSIVIATGARPVVPPLSGLEEAGYVTSDTLWDELSRLEAAPRRLVVLGGGPIGCELAQALARLGAGVTLVEMGEFPLPAEDADVSALTQAALEADGVTVLTGHRALSCESASGERALVVDRQGAEHRICYDMLLCAVGREARLNGYGLEELGIPVNRAVATNGFLETLYPNIHAAGDVVGPYQFTHLAAHQAWHAAVNSLFGPFKKFRVDYSVIPRVTFTDPEVARVGLNEQEARQQGVFYEVTRYDLADLDRAITDGAAHGFIKVLTVPGKDRILGVTIVGEHAGELLAEYVLAMKHGLGLNKILGTLHAYPTLAEANKFVAGEWRRAHAPKRLLAWLERFHAWRRG